MSHIVLDIAIVAIFVFLIVLGYRRGLILSAFSLLSVIVALLGALALTSLFAPLLRDALVPTFENRIRPSVEEVIPPTESSLAKDLDGVLADLKERDLPLHLNEAIDDVDFSSLKVGWTVESLVHALALLPAAAIAYCTVGLASFVLMLLAWKLLAKIFNWIAKLPGLNFLNRTGGVLLGALEGALLVVLLVGLLRRYHFITDAEAAKSIFLPWILKGLSAV